MIALLKSLRPLDWTKNLFLLLPLLFGKKLFVYPGNLHTAEGFLLFCAAASAGYLLNDWIDRESDRAHPEKALRPIAAGRFGGRGALWTSAALAGGALAGGFALDPFLGCTVGAYLFLSLAYTLWLRQRVLVDVLSVSAFFLFRVLAGSLTAQVWLSHWLIFMTFLLALFLGFSKRYQELQSLGGERAAACRPVLVRYTAPFLLHLILMISGAMIVVYMLYTVDTRTICEFGTGDLLFTVPVFCYAVFRYLYLVTVRGRPADPAAMLLTDRPFLLSLVLWTAMAFTVVYVNY